MFILTAGFSDCRLHFGIEFGFEKISSMTPNSVGLMVPASNYFMNIYILNGRFTINFIKAH